MSQTEPVIEDSRAVEDLHHLRLMALLHELVREKGNRGAASVLGIDPRTVASCMKTGRLSWRVREALEQGLQSGAGSAAARQRERNDALEGRSEEMERELRGGASKPSWERSRRSGRSTQGRCGTWSGGWCGWRRETVLRMRRTGHLRPVRTANRGRSEGTPQTGHIPNW